MPFDSQAAKPGVNTISSLSVCVLKNAIEAEVIAGCLNTANRGDLPFLAKCFLKCLEKNCAIVCSCIGFLQSLNKALFKND